jgi:uncharacterized protein YndB with AHSA1/START domain
MLKLEVSSEIKRPVEEVFAYWTDPAAVPEWNSAVLECRAEPPGPLRVGSKMHTVGSILGRRLESTLEVTELVPNRKLVYKTNSPFALAATYLTEPTAGGTKVSVDVVAEPGGFFKVAEPVLGRLTKKQFEMQLETIKELLEAREPTRVGN